MFFIDPASVIIVLLSPKTGVFDIEDFTFFVVCRCFLKYPALIPLQNPEIEI